MCACSARANCLHPSRQRRANEANPPILAPRQCKAMPASSPKLEDQKQCNSMLLDSEISSGQAAKIKVGQTCLSDVCVFKHFRFWRPNGWVDRDGGGTVRCAGTPERRWCRSRVDRCHVARATCPKVNQLQIFFVGAAGQAEATRKSKLDTYMRLIGRHHPLGVLAPMGAGCTHQGGKRKFRWAPLISGNFELAPRNLAHR